MQQLTENEIEWLYSTTVQKLKESFRDKTITELDFDAEMLKIKIWAEKAYEALDNSSGEE